MSDPATLSQAPAPRLAAPPPPPLAPKKKAIRLPFHVSYLPNDAVAKTQRLCGICHQNPSPYACPRCQVPYCSLACFQSPKHAQCSEGFYQAEVTRELQAAPRSGAQRSGEEKNKMFEMLKRFEEGAGGEGPLEWDEGSGEGQDAAEDDGLDDLAELLETAGLDGIPPEQLLAMLPANLRTQFLSSVASSSSSTQPSSVLETLLTSDELRSEERAPWWLDGETDGVQVGEALPDGAEVAKARTRAPPEAVEVPQGLKPALEVAQKVMFNILAVAIAYVHTTLTFRRSPLAEPSSAGAPAGTALEDARAMLDHLLSLVPFVEDPRSTVLLGTAEQARVYAESHLDPSSVLPSAVLLTHLAPLVRPPSPVLFTDLPPPPSPLSLALSDLHLLLAQTADARTRSAHRKNQRKVEYYLACVAAWTRDDWVRLEARVRREFGKDAQGQEGQGEEEVFVPVERPHMPERAGTPKIELVQELPVSGITEIVEDGGDVQGDRLVP